MDEYQGYKGIKSTYKTIRLAGNLARVTVPTLSTVQKPALGTSYDALTVQRVPHVTHFA